MRSIFALCLIAVFAFYAIRGRYAGMLMYWWFGIFRPHEWMWWDLSALRLPLLAAALFLIPTLFNGIFPRVKHPLAVLMCVFLVFMFLGLINGGCDFGGPRMTERMVTLVLVILLTERLLNSEKAILGLFFTFSMSLLYYSANEGFSAAFTGASLYDKHIVGGTFSDSNNFALGTGMMLFFLLLVIQVLHAKFGTVLLPKFLHKKGPRMLLLGLLVIVVPLSMYAIVATNSRGSALSLAAGGFIWMFLHAKRIKIFFACLVLGIAGIAVVGVPEAYIERLKTAFAEEEERDKSAASRPYFWSLARNMADEYTMGVGLGCYSEYYDRFDETGGYYGNFRSVHSSHFQIIGEMGWPGLTLWVILLVYAFWRLWRLRKSCIPGRDTCVKDWFFFYFCNALIASHAVFVIGGSFYEFALNDVTWLIFGLIIAGERLKNSLDAKPMDEALAQQKSI